MWKRSHTKMVHEGSYIAEVDVEIINSSEEGWSPYISLDDAMKLDQVRDALRRGDLQNAQRMARVYKLSRIDVA
jgi:hypothetical protein